MFKRAQRKRSKARIGLVGPAGSGKTYSALLLAFGLAPQGRIAVIDTEHGSADLYADLGEYDTAHLEPPFTVENYLRLIREAEQAGYDVIVIDSLSHAWAGTGGLLDLHDRLAAKTKNSYTAWRDVTPKHNDLIEAMLQSSAHIIATMRAKTEYILVDERGKKVPKKVGMAPVQREGMDYEFTIVFDIDQDKHIASTSKDRTSLFDGFCDRLTTEHGAKLRDWLESGAAPEPKPEPESSPKPAGEEKPSGDAVGIILEAAKDAGLSEEDLLGHLAAGPGETLGDFDKDTLRTLYREIKAGKVGIGDAGEGVADG